MAGIKKVASVALLAFSCLLVPSVAVASPERSISPDPAIQPRIVNGQGTTIDKWPWQVALLDVRFGSSATSRYFCTGALIAPDLVVTAAHCVSHLRPKRLKYIRVVAGRTWLNQTSTGDSLGISRVVMALDAKGKRRYRDRNETLVWDVALLKLAKTTTLGSPIPIAGASEQASWRPGRLVKTSGWGETRAFSGRASDRLRIGNQVVLPDGVCRRYLGRAYRPKTMICHGGPEGKSSSCVGDSGGPLVSPVDGGWRLVGLTSYGDSACRGRFPSVDNRTASNPVRSWIRGKAVELSGYDPVSEGGGIGPLPPSCKVPALAGRTRKSAGAALRKAGCRLGKVMRVDRPSFRKGRVVGASLPAGWLVPPGFGIGIRISR